MWMSRLDVLNLTLNCLLEHQATRWGYCRLTQLGIQLGACMWLKGSRLGFSFNQMLYAVWAGRIWCLVSGAQD